MNSRKLINEVRRDMASFWDVWPDPKHPLKRFELAKKFQNIQSINNASPRPSIKLWFACQLGLDNLSVGHLGMPKPKRKRK